MKIRTSFLIKFADDFKLDVSSSVHEDNPQLLSSYIPENYS